MIKLEQTTKLLLLTLLILVSLAGLLTWQTLSFSSQRITLSREVEQLTTDNSRYQSMSVSFTNHALQFQAWQQLLPVNETEVALFAAQVENLANQTQLTLELHFDDFPGQVETQKKLLFGIATDISLEGSYQNLITFMSQLQRLPHFYRIDKLILTRQETNRGVEATLQGILYMRQHAP